MSPDDVYLLTRRIDTLTRTATSIRRHLADLHSLAYDAQRSDSEPDRAGFEERPPPGYRLEPSKAQHLWSRISLQVGQVEDILTGLERQLTACFYARSQSPEPSRGSLISRAEHDMLLANQKARRAAGQYTPAPLIDQPHHPGAQR